MNADDLRVIRDLIARSNDNVQMLQHVTQFGAVDGDSDDVEGLRAQLTELRADIGRITRVIQDREARSWGRPDHPQHHEAPPRLAPPVQSIDLPSDVPVQRFDVQGAPAAELKGPMPIMGQWAQRWTTRRQNNKQTFRKVSPWTLAKFSTGRAPH